MSRIHEARKKVSGQTRGAEPSDTPSKPVPSAVAASGKTLDEYPAEHDSALDQNEHIDRDVPPTIRPTARTVTRDLTVQVEERRPEAPTPPAAVKLVSTVVHKGSLVPVDPEQKLIVHDDVPARWADSFVDLARTLEATRHTRPLKTLMVMSTQRGEGRTLTAANLALVLSERLGRRVLLIDGDVQRPSTTRLFNLSNTFRLSDILQPSTREVPVSEVSPTLAVLGTDPSNANAMSVLVSSAMRTLLKAAADYDWVLIDTPPLQSMPEAHLLTWMVDGVLLVIGARTTRRKAVEMAVHDLGGGSRIVGVMLNRG